MAALWGRPRHWPWHSGAGQALWRRRPHSAPLETGGGRRERGSLAWLGPAAEARRRDWPGRGGEAAGLAGPGRGGGGGGRTELPHPSDPQGTGGPGDGLWPGQGSGGTVHQGLREEALPGGVSLLDGPQDAAGGAVRQEDTEEPPEENHLDGGGVLVSGRIKPVKNGKEMAVIREKEIERQKQMGKLPKLPHHTELRPPTLRTPCQQELDQVLERISTMRLPDERGPLEHLYSLNIPNCDKQGLYNLKQCKMSVNGQRGECWCVNPNTGKVIQGAPTMRGDPQCHLFYTVHEQEDRGMQALSVQ
ncbi:insulin-like growth factor-binding protein 2 isoform X2 [Hemicordylus capensis]|uniref:insulin-like growth factor-binding protein 2 isoform X2 n=1 Tax=Hemicordylus capensis TaxID=884348 RepID=UPI0023024271|nr:insulin-like growth factor-binding protein 2 isoform X2 [Hemicordylus capensis]